MKKFSVLFIYCGCVLIGISLYFTFSNILTDKNAGIASQAALTQIKQAAPEQETSEAVLPAYKLYPEMEMPAVTVDSISYIGTIQIPSLELELPVISHWSLENYKKAPCRYAGTAYQPGFVLSAHNYSSHFGSIRLLQEGDLVIFTDTDNNRFEYRVIMVEILTPTDIESMTSTDYDLTLFTCTPGGKYRVTVRCELLKH